MGTRSRRTRRVLVGAVVVMLLLGACGSGALASMKPAEAKSEIGRAYATVFNFANHNVTTKTKVIQNGSTLRTALTQALASPLAKQATGAKVVTVQLLSVVHCQQAALRSPCAEVTYNLLGANNVPLFATPSAGYAVYLGGRWLVAKATICGLLELYYSASGRKGVPRGC